jgi:Peptidase_C39 like family/Secretion system C-terminal sorting domain
MAIKFLLLIIIMAGIVFGQPYPDQYYSYEKDSLVQRINNLNGMEVGKDGENVVLSDGVTSGYVIFDSDSSEFPFNRGLPSWNGHVPNDSSSFKVLMRYYNQSSAVWSPWLTIGFWKANIWSSYGYTSYSGGKIDIDNAVLNSYNSKWQFKVEMKRTSISQPSPSLYKLGFFVSDQKTTDNVNINSIVADKPNSILIKTEHYYQYSLDPGIGGDICSPTSVSMVLRSYNINVDPLQFARDNYDTYYGMFGIWPRAVQNAAEYGLEGAVTRYRTWSQAYKILAAGGRIVMSVGEPLYAGHLMMLAGFDAAGNPLVHDPARKNGYAYKFDKTSLSESWFNKGGVAYTFYPSDSTSITSVKTTAFANPDEFDLLNNYPNPFNPTTLIEYKIADEGFVSLKVYDVLGREISTLVNENKKAGNYRILFDASNLPSGIYIYSIYFQSPGSIPNRINRKMLYLK